MLKRRRNNLTMKKKERILERDGWKCYICGDDMCALEIHHIVPIISGGKDNDSNLVSLCRECHIAIHTDDIERCVKNAVYVSKRRLSEL